MSRNLSRNLDRAPRRRWLEAAGVVLVTGVTVTFAAAAIAASPKTGCWGTCGGDSGPVGGYFNLSKGRVESFAVAESCLGRDNSSGLENIVYHIPNMRITGSGKFAYRGKADRYVNSSRTNHPLHITLVGRFLTRTKATISLTIYYGHCGTKKLTVRYAG